MQDKRTDALLKLEQAAWHHATSIVARFFKIQDEEA
jgi:hypothetical protein